MTEEFVVREASPDPAGVEQLLRALPNWFGIESAIVDYVRDAATMQTIVAAPAGGDAGRPIGVLLLRRHFPQAGEIHLMAVDPTWHRRGVGAALVRVAEQVLVADGAELLSVKTLGPSHPDPGYASTRLFYQAMGFLPVEEIHDLWPGNPCLILVKQLRRR